MKAPTTWLVDRAMARQPVVEDELQASREAAQAVLVGPVVDACTFSRPSNHGVSMAASRGGLITRGLYRRTQEVRAGGLPQHFLLAVTHDEVVALEQKPDVRGVAALETRGEVARWTRSAIEVEGHVSGYLINVTIVVPGEDEKIACCVVKTDTTADFVALLGNPQRQTRAHR